VNQIGFDIGGVLKKVLFILISLALFSCSTYDSSTLDNRVTSRYLSLSHTRTSVNIQLDSTSSEIDFGAYDGLLLGGDLMLQTSEAKQAMDYVDSIYSLSSENVLWALGNHDYKNVDLISDYTGRASFYTWFSDGITFVVLDTQLNACSIEGEQRDMLEQVIDTISKSNQLVILSHKLIWMYDNQDLEPRINVISNGIFGTCSHCVIANNFNKDIYPELIGVQQSGIDVVCVAGDIGNKVKSFEHVTDDGVTFIGSGIKSGDSGNLGLILEKHGNQELTWHFEELSSL